MTDQPFTLSIDKTRARYIFADLRLQHVELHQYIIVAEVKCFSETLPFLSEFYVAVGQYAAYRNALMLNGFDYAVYLVVPSGIFETYFHRPLIHAMIQDVTIRIIVVDLGSEEVVRWID